jgi:uncharacterized protein YqgC (DUF456 family)
MVKGAIPGLVFFIVCGFVCRALAVRRDLDGMFWFVMGVVCGPLAFPFVYMFGERKEPK